MVFLIFSEMEEEEFLVEESDEVAYIRSIKSLRTDVETSIPSFRVNTMLIKLAT